MKIGVVTPSLHAGGAEHVLRQWITSTSSSFNAEWFAYLYGPADSGNDVVGSLPCQSRQYLARAKFGRALGLPRWLRSQMRQDGIDVCLSMMTYSNLVALLGLKTPFRKSGIPIVISERNVPTLYMPLEGRSGTAQILLARHLYNRADAALAISHATAADLLNFGVESHRIRVLPNPAATTLDARPRPEGARESRIDVLFVGRFVNQKRPELFVDTIAELRRRGVNAHGTAIGSGPLEASTRRRAAELSVPVEFLGWVEDWREHGLRSDVLLLTSSVEGFGNVLLEAASVGLPSVAVSGALGVADAIIPGVTGCLSFDSSPARLADEVLKARQLPMNPEAVSPWLARFSPENSAALLHDMLTSVTDGGMGC